MTLSAVDEATIRRIRKHFSENGKQPSLEQKLMHRIVAAKYVQYVFEMEVEAARARAKKVLEDPTLNYNQDSSILPSTSGVPSKQTRKTRSARHRPYNTRRNKKAAAAKKSQEADIAEDEEMEDITKIRIALKKFNMQ